MKCVLWSILLYFNWRILLVFKNMESNKMHSMNNRPTGKTNLQL